MSRVFGQILTAMWNDPDFRELSVDAQWAYVMLSTQADVSSAGVLGITLRRWTMYAKDANVERLRAGLGELREKRFIIADFDSEELLIRTFIKHDRGYNNPKRLPNILRALDAIQSTPLRLAAAEELTKLRVEMATDSPSHTDSDSPSDGLSQGLSHSPGIGTGTGKGTGTGSRASSKKRPTHQLPADLEPLFAEFWDAYPRKIGKVEAKRRFGEALDDGADAGTVIEGARRYATHIEYAGTEQRYVAHPSTWLTRGGWDDDYESATIITGGMRGYEPWMNA